MIRVPVNPDLLRWARERSGQPVEALTGKFPKLPGWERGEVQPTFKQLEDFARATFTPIGFLFLLEPPVEGLPIPDARVGIERRAARPSPDLLETIYLCQQRQAWYHAWARSAGEAPSATVGSVRPGAPVNATAAALRHALVGDTHQDRPALGFAPRNLFHGAERLGVLVMVSAVVPGQRRRRLDPEEFSGFGLADDLAPLVFLSGAETRACHTFTCARLLAHLSLGRSALVDLALDPVPTVREAAWCVDIALELLAPRTLLREMVPRGASDAELRRLARRSGLDLLVLLRRLRDAGHLSGRAFRRAHADELARLRSLTRGSNEYQVPSDRTSRRFTRALVTSTLEGQTPYPEAFRLLGIANEATFRRDYVVPCMEWFRQRLTATPPRQPREGVTP